MQGLTTPVAVAILQGQASNTARAPAHEGQQPRRGQLGVEEADAKLVHRWPPIRPLNRRVHARHQLVAEVDGQLHTIRPG